MKNKVFILIAAVLMIGLSVSAQDSGTSFGLRGGLNMQNISGKNLSGDKLELSMVPRFHAGIVIAVPIAPDFYFQPGLMFSTKGAKSENNFLGLVDYSVEYNLSYIEMPLSFLYKPLVGKGHFFLGFGPYIAYGIGGKAKLTVGTASNDEDVVFTKDYVPQTDSDWKYFKNFDYGGNLFFGYELSGGLSLQLNTQLGLAKINAERKNSSSDAEFRNTGFGVSLGYNF